MKRVLSTKMDSRQKETANETTQDTIIIGCCLGADALVGDGLKDQIPEALRAAAEHLHRHGEVEYDDVRETLSEHLASGPESVAGYVHKLQGQIGEDQFVAEHPEFILSSSGSQEAVDAWRVMDDGVVEAVQVKTWDDADGLTEGLASANKAVADGIEVDGHVPDILSVGVPSDIAEEVEARLASHPTLEDVHVIPFGDTAKGVSEAVKGAAEAVDDSAAHLASEILDFIPSVLAVSAAAEILRVMAGKKTPEQAGEDLGGKVVRSVVATAAAGTASLIFSGALIPIGVGMFVRYKLGQAQRHAQTGGQPKPQSQSRPVVANW